MVTRFLKVPFLSELNNMPAWRIDIGNMYLEAYIKEKFVICAGPEFGHQAGQFLVINKTLYGLRSSRQRFKKLIGKCLLSLGFEHSKCEANILIYDAGNYHEYAARYVDDLVNCVKDPKKLLKQLQRKPFDLKLK